MYGKKEQEFLSIVNSCLSNSAILIEKINSVELFLDKIIDLRNLHLKLSKELEFKLMPNYDVYFEQGLVKGNQYIYDLKVDIYRICVEIGAVAFFPDEKTLEFKRRLFAVYRIRDFDISNLIYFNEKEKQKYKNLDHLDLD